MKTTLLALAAACAMQSAAASPLDDELAAIVRKPELQIASLSVFAVHNGKPVYQQAFGQQQIGGAPATPATMYRIASISKMVTTLGVMKLVEQGKLDLEADVSLYLGFKLRNPQFPDAPITLRLLLSHQSSLRDDGGYSWPNSTALADAIGPQSWAKDKGPGAFYTYCNLNWGVIGTIMEAVSGERFDLLMRRLVLEPLGMEGGYHAATFTPAQLGRLATLYRKRTTDTEIWDSKGPWIPQVDDYRTTPPRLPENYVIGRNATPFSPTGGLRVSAPDLGKVMMMYLNHGKPLLQPATLDRMLQREWTFDGKNGDTEEGFHLAWGLGNQQFDGSRLVESGRFQAIGHLGEAYGLYSVFFVDREHGDGIIMLSGGTSAPPPKGKYSALEGFTEQVLTAVYRRAIQGQ